MPNFLLNFLLNFLSDIWLRNSLLMLSHDRVRFRKLFTTNANSGRAWSPKVMNCVFDQWMVCLSFLTQSWVAFFGLFDMGNWEVPVWWAMPVKFSKWEAKSFLGRSILDRLEFFHSCNNWDLDLNWARGASDGGLGEEETFCHFRALRLEGVSHKLLSDRFVSSSESSLEESLDVSVSLSLFLLEDVKIKY